MAAGSDFVCYWFAAAREQIEDGELARAGMVATYSIRGGANRAVLAAIVKTGRIFDAWADEGWTLDGAAVRVSRVCLDGANGGRAQLDGQEVAEVQADLTARRADGAGLDLTKADCMPQNLGVAVMGDIKGDAFDIPGDRAREILLLPVNPNGRADSDVLRPWVNGIGITGCPADTWIIGCGWTMTEGQAALCEEPFRLCLLFVKPERDKNRRDTYRQNWWRHLEARHGMWAAVGNKSRWIVTPRVSRHRLFVWLSTSVVPASATIAIARDDDTTFGILHARFHELWSLRMGTSLEDRPRSTPSTTFETFRFPAGLTPDIPAASYADGPRAQAIAAARLNELRENRLNPADLVLRVPDVVPGYPDRILPRDEAAAKVLKARTLTDLKNTRPAWLAHAHATLDQAVADACGWGAEWKAGMDDDTILARLFALNQARAKGA